MGNYVARAKKRGERWKSEAKLERDMKVKLTRDWARPLPFPVCLSLSLSLIRRKGMIEFLAPLMEKEVSYGPIIFPQSVREREKFPREAMSNSSFKRKLLCSALLYPTSLIYIFYCFVVGTHTGRRKTIWSDVSCYSTRNCVTFWPLKVMWTMSVFHSIPFYSVPCQNRSVVFTCEMRFGWAEESPLCSQLNWTLSIE